MTEDHTKIERVNELISLINSNTCSNNGDNSNMKESGIVFILLLLGSLKIKKNLLSSANLLPKKS